MANHKGATEKAATRRLAALDLRKDVISDYGALLQCCRSSWRISVILEMSRSVILKKMACDSLGS